MLEVVDITAADAYGVNICLYRHEDRMADRVTVGVTGRPTQSGVQRHTEWQNDGQSDRVAE